MNVTTLAAINLKCDGFIGDTFSLMYRLPRRWALELCATGKRVEWLKWFTASMDRLGLFVDTVLDGTNGDVIFIVSPKEVTG